MDALNDDSFLFANDPVLVANVEQKSDDLDVSPQVSVVLDSARSIAGGLGRRHR